MTEIDPIMQSAARWHARQTVGLLPDENRALDAWLAADVRHRIAYADIAAAAFAFDQLAPRAAREVRQPRRWPVWAGATLAPIALIACFLFLPHAWQNWHSDRHTEVGVTLSQKLPDGTTLQLDTDSAVALPFSPERRDVELLRGALAVDVAKDPKHPFRVYCSGVEATAVGTRFVVAHRGDAIEVGVTEGIVSVRADHDAEPVLVIAGSVARIDLPHRNVAQTPMTATAYGWTRGVLSFEQAPLETVATELARYLPQRVVFRARKHATNPVTATFPVDDPQSALLALARTQGLTVRHFDGWLTIIDDD